MWFDSSECRYAGREVERISYARAATLNSILWVEVYGSTSTRGYTRPDPYPQVPTRMLWLIVSKAANRSKPMSVVKCVVSIDLYRLSRIRSTVTLSPSNG